MKCGVVGLKILMLLALQIELQGMLGMMLHMDLQRRVEVNWTVLRVSLPGPCVLFGKVQRSRSI